MNDQSGSPNDPEATAASGPGTAGSGPGTAGSGPGTAGSGPGTVWDAIRSRRNVRQYASRPISGPDLDQILEAGRRSPSSRNTQPWDFISVTAPDQLQQLATVWVGAGHVAHCAAAIALITAADDDAQRRAQFDLGQAAMSMLLAAAGLGIGSCHSGIGDQDSARRMLGLPPDKFCHFLISLGYPAGRPLTPISVPDRRPFDEVIHREHW
jgi:nitroreductase